jgi:pSer/pThr/pTyr-binding forkhead associated (FHA) protein
MQTTKKTDKPLTASGPMLTIREGDTLRSIELGPEPMTVGRSRQCGLVIKTDKCVSRLHCEIICIDGKYTVFDKSGDNGIFVNGAKVGTQILGNGDEITLGASTIVFNTLDDAPLAETMAPVKPKGDHDVPQSPSKHATRRHRGRGHASVRGRSYGAAIAVIVAVLVVVFAAVAIFSSKHANRAVDTNVTETSAAGSLKPVAFPVASVK